MEKIPNYLSVFYYPKINWTSDIQYYYFLKAVIQSPKKNNVKKCYTIQTKKWAKRSNSKIQNENVRNMLLNLNKKGVTQSYKMKMWKMCYSIQTKKWAKRSWMRKKSCPKLQNENVWNVLPHLSKKNAQKGLLKVTKWECAKDVTQSVQKKNVREGLMKVTK